MERLKGDTTIFVRVACFYTQLLKIQKYNHDAFIWCFLIWTKNDKQWLYTFPQIEITLAGNIHAYK